MASKYGKRTTFIHWHILTELNYLYFWFWVYSIDVMMMSKQPNVFAVCMDVLKSLSRKQHFLYGKWWRPHYLSNQVLFKIEKIFSPSIFSWTQLHGWFTCTSGESRNENSEYVFIEFFCGGKLRDKDMVSWWSWSSGKYLALTVYDDNECAFENRPCTNWFFFV